MLIAAKYIIEDNNPTIDGCFSNISSTIDNLNEKNSHQDKINFITNIYKKYIKPNISLEESFYIGNTNVPGKKKALTVSSEMIDRSNAYENLIKEPKPKPNQVSLPKNH